MKSFVLAPVAIILATAAASPSAWDGFSSQSAPSYSLVTTSATAQPGIAVLHAAASYGVASSAGIPEPLGVSCNDLRTTLVPFARKLANARALAFASDLGVELGRNLREDLQPAYTDPLLKDPSGCGMPKLGRYPFGTVVDETYALQTRALSLESPPIFLPEPATFLYTNDYNVVPPLLPFEAFGTHMVRARGYAALRPDTVALDILLVDKASVQVMTSNSRQQDTLLLAPTLAAIQRAAPSAVIDPTARDGADGIGNHTIVASARVTIADPSETVVAAIDRAAIASSDPSVEVYVSRRLSSASCESLEGAARRDAIARARAEIAASGEASGPIDLTFADEQPPEFVGGICGPQIDGFTFPERREATKDAEIPLTIGAYVPIELRYHLHPAY